MWRWLLSCALVSNVVAFSVQLNVTSSSCNFEFCGANVISASPNITWPNPMCDSGTSNCTLSPGVYNVTVNHQFSGLDFGSCVDACVGLSLVSIWSWAGLNVDTNTAFRNCSNLAKVVTTDQPIFPPGASLANFFLNCAQLQIPGGLTWDLANNVVSTESMFDGASRFNSKVTFFNTESLRFMDFMFRNAIQFSTQPNISTTSSVESMRGMFQGSNFNQNFPFDSSNCSDFSSMFESSPFNRPLTLNTSKATTFARMFASTPFNFPITFAANAVTTVEAMFENASSFNSAVSLLNSSALTTTAAMFRNTPSFNSTLTADLTSVIYMDYMYAGTKRFNLSLSLATPNLQSVKYMFAGATAFNNIVNLTNCNGNLNATHMFDSATAFNNPFSLCANYFSDTSFLLAGASAYNQPLNIVLVQSSTASMFANAGAFSQAVAFNTGSVTNMRSMFEGARAFKQNLTLDTGNVQDMSLMFKGNSMQYNMTLSLDTNSVQNMSGMFQGTLVAFNVNFTSTRTVADMSFMFADSQFNSRVEFDTMSVLYMNGMFANSSFNSIINFSDTSEIESMREMFKDALNFSQPVQHWVPSSVRDMSYMFAGARSFNRPLFNSTGSVSDMIRMFYYAEAFNQSVYFDTKSVVNMEGMFYGVRNTFDLNFTDTSQVTDMSSMFRMSLYNKRLDLDTRNVTTMQDMFRESKFNSYLNFSDTSKVTTMQGMFQNASSFNQSVQQLNTSSVTNMAEMFSGAANFSQPVQLWNTSNVEDMSSMFSWATNFNQPVQQWDTSSVTKMQYMFAGASNFNQLLFNSTKNVTDMSYMFYQALKFNQPVSFDTMKVQNMQSMFKYASKFNQPINFYISDPNATTLVLDYMLLAAAEFNQPFMLYASYSAASAYFMFYQAVAMNQTVSLTVRALTNATSMFAFALNFSQPLNLSTANLTDMTSMFEGADNFEQNLANWTTNQTTSCNNFCLNCGLPSFPNCFPCARPQRYQSLGQSKCSCPQGQVPNSAFVCGLPPANNTNSTNNPTSVSLPYVGTTTMFTMAGGVEVTIPQDDKFGTNGTIVATVSSSNDTTTVSQVLTIVFLDPTTNQEKSIQNLSSPVNFTLPLIPGTASFRVCRNGALAMAVPECRWYDTVALVWTASGCSSVVTATEVRCSCTHLTDFAAVMPNYNRLPLAQFRSLTSENINEYPAGIIAISIVLCLFALLLVVSMYRDREVMVRQDLKFRKRVTVDENSKNGDMEAAPSPPSLSSSALLWKNFKSGLQMYHTWGSLLLRKTGTTYRAVDRAFVTLNLLLIMMTMSAHFHGRNSTFLGRSGVMIVSLLPSVSSALLLSHLFTHTGEMGALEKQQLEQTVKLKPRCPCMDGLLQYRFPERCRYLWYAMVLSSAVGMIIYILAIALMFDQNPDYFCKGETAQAWLVDFIVPYAIAVFLLEPARILFLVSSQHILRVGRMSKSTSFSKAKDVETS